MGKVYAFPSEPRVSNQQILLLRLFQVRRTIDKAIARLERRGASAEERLLDPSRSDSKEPA